MYSSKKSEVELINILVAVWSSSSILVKLAAFKYRSWYGLKKVDDVFAFPFLKNREFRHACFRPTKRNGSKPQSIAFSGQDSRQEIREKCQRNCNSRRWSAVPSLLGSHSKWVLTTAAPISFQVHSHRFQCDFITNLAPLFYRRHVVQNVHTSQLKMWCWLSVYR